MSPNPSQALRLLLETVLDAVIVMSSEGRIVEWNDRAEELFGWTKAEVAGCVMGDIIVPPQYRKAHQSGLQTYLATGAGPVLGKRLELSALTKSGEEIPVELSISPIDEDGELIFVGCLRDIRASKSVQRTLKNTAAHFDLLIQSAKDYAIYMIGPTGTVMNWNAGAERIKGYTRNEIVGQNFSKFYTDQDRKAGAPERVLRTAREHGKYETEGWRVRKDGSQFWASISLSPIFDEKQELIGFVKITRDETGRRATEQELKVARERMLEMQKMEAVGQLTGGVAHDFNNLLTIIIGNLETAQHRIAGLEGDLSLNIKRVVDRAMIGARRAAGLTQRLLAFSRKQPLVPKPLDVNKFLASTADFLQRSLGESIEIENVGAGGLWRIEVDVNQLEAALLNLAVNARDAMEGAGKLTLEARNVYLDNEYARQNPEVIPGQYVVICVSDTGSGMTPETMGRAFEPFFTTKEVGQGTGLGLSQVYGFLKQSGGHIKIYSEVGEGTTIKLYFPRLAANAEGTDEAGKAQPVFASIGGETILLVEDDDDVRTFLRETLLHLKYQVVDASNAGEAMRYVEQRYIRIDLLLTDVVLPGENGRILAEKAKGLRPELKVLFMTGYSRNAIVHHGRLDPGVELLQKPIAQSELSARLRELLDGA